MDIIHERDEKLRLEEEERARAAAGGEGGGNTSGVHLKPKQPKGLVRAGSAKTDMDDRASTMASKLASSQANQDLVDSFTETKQNGRTSMKASREISKRQSEEIRNSVGERVSNERVSVLEEQEAQMFVDVGVRKGYERQPYVFTSPLPHAPTASRACGLVPLLLPPVMRACRAGSMCRSKLSRRSTSCPLPTPFPSSRLSSSTEGRVHAVVACRLPGRSIPADAGCKPQNG